ncbi:ribosome-binding factor A [Candidatus Desantisbacteria bacterium CG1_02_38_46]|uniref:Ribosome-binding factor A n=2 Tax=unclassified Candidatus Desantisiibacteriota TaxID=3106372 RepID=A0A1J4SHQ8_9BACT|nr:MAG: ribosome-binding factor A [Candidatus Desantisbacteria bacterium CG1_02_38_46]PIU52092.1 MAG: ribosome-binding factor A [Candidatus Desantisbacteria bacterium CG07_land_8_20_14_0_80_39_15]
MSERRMQRINEFIREEVALLIQREIKDPRIGFVTVLGCKVTNDLKEAKVYISILGDKKQKEESLAGLQSAAGFIQSKVGNFGGWRSTPKITFHLDESAEEAARIEELLKKICNSRL